MSSLSDIRTGLGVDVHSFVAGRPLILCGCRLPHTLGLAGHSDADVAVHALMDALLGAAALGDIGRRFPDSDPAYAGASSLLLLDDVWAEIRAQGWQLGNCDLVLVAQAPRLAPYIDEMRACLASRLEVEPSRVGLKATTSEGLGFTGRAEGILALATVLLLRYAT